MRNSGPIKQDLLISGPETEKGKSSGGVIQSQNAGSTMIFEFHQASVNHDLHSLHYFHQPGINRASISFLN